MLELLELLEFLSIPACSFMCFYLNVAWVTRPERPKGAKDDVKQALGKTSITLSVCPLGTLPNSSYGLIFCKNRGKLRALFWQMPVYTGDMGTLLIKVLHPF